jgi:hypothetical protein
MALAYPASSVLDTGVVALALASAEGMLVAILAVAGVALAQIA